MIRLPAGGRGKIATGQTKGIWTGDSLVEFQEKFARLDFASAAAIFERALEDDPGGAFRYFVAHAGGELAEALSRSDRRAHIACKLDGLLTEHPHVHCLSNPDDPADLENVVALREANIDKGLPSVLFVPAAKSASVAVAAIFQSGFELPSFCYSLVNLDIIDSWARDYARGGACYATHLIPSMDNVSRIKRAGITRMIVHVRDPRQALVSLVHHFDLYPRQLPKLKAKAAKGHSVSERAANVLEWYSELIGWIEGWIDAESEINILFSTHEQFAEDRRVFVERYLEFYGGDRRYFSYENALAQQPGTDYHFRRGMTDEWRTELDPAFVDCLSELLPERLKTKFGWRD